MQTAPAASRGEQPGDVPDLALPEPQIRTRRAVHLVLEELDRQLRARVLAESNQLGQALADLERRYRWRARLPCVEVDPELHDAQSLPGARPKSLHEALRSRGCPHVDDPAEHRSHGCVLGGLRGISRAESAD